VFAISIHLGTIVNYGDSALHIPGTTISVCSSNDYSNVGKWEQILSILNLYLGFGVQNEKV